jgi:flagellar basal-body rod protein FlgB
MDLDNLGLFKLMSRRMGWLTQRQEVLSQNIANANTPNYKPEDLKPFTFQDALGDSHRMEMTLTATGHLPGTRPTADNKARRQRDTYETKPDGNAVVLEEQMMKVGQTQMDYDTVLNLYKKQLSMIQTAARGSR